MSKGHRGHPYPQIVAVFNEPFHCANQVARGAVTVVGDHFQVDKEDVRSGADPAAARSRTTAADQPCHGGSMSVSVDVAAHQPGLTLSEIHRRRNPGIGNVGMIADA